MSQSLRVAKYPFNFSGTWIHVGTGRHRQVWRRDGSQYVIKIPLNEAGWHDNMREHNLYKLYKSRPFAPCRLLKDGCLLMLYVEHVGYSKEDDWTWGIDCGQVGVTPAGKLVAYDYAE